jgi:CubicO group peptidase (beta-lactamase class C family)
MQILSSLLSQLILARTFFAALALVTTVSLSGCAITYDKPRASNELTQAKITDTALLEKAHAFLQRETAFDAFVALRGESLITRWGNADLPINTHSVRKSLLSALYGIAAAKGLINLDATLGDLQIDEKATPLTATERKATVRQLLMSRSGVYLEAAGETAAMRDGRPKRGQYRPGEFFYYNNWDFNVLGVIFEQQTGIGIGQAMEDWIAKPVGMQTFRADHVIYQSVSQSQHRQFVIFMSAADLAQLGTLYVQQGRWGTKQVIPADWVRESFQAHSTVTSLRPFDGYGYLWWLDSKDKTAWADGWRGQYMIIDQARQLVVVSRNDTGRNVVSALWATMFGKDGFRDHHQQLHRWMAEAVK